MGTLYTPLSLYFCWMIWTERTCTERNRLDFGTEWNDWIGFGNRLELGTERIWDWFWTNDWTDFGRIWTTLEWDFISLHSHTHNNIWFWIYLGRFRHILWREPRTQHKTSDGFWFCFEIFDIKTFTLPHPSLAFHYLTREAGMSQFIFDKHVLQYFFWLSVLPPKGPGAIITRGTVL